MKLILAFGFLCALPVLVQAQIAPIENRVPRPARLVVALPDPLRELGAAPSFPVPPAQNAPWNGNSDSFGAVVKRMFDAGLADPRGLEYREVEFTRAPTLWRAQGETAPSTRGFMLPASDPDARFAIAWDGQIYRVSRVGELKNALADLAAMKQKPLAPGERFGWWNSGTQLDLHTPTVLKAVLAERLGAPRSLYSEIQLKSAALAFVTQLSGRARFAHLRGDDPTALALLRKERFARQSLSDVFPETATRDSDFQSPALPDDDQLLADQERREKERLAAPTAAPNTPLQRLIDDLQNVDARQMTLPGSVNFLDDERVRSLVELGDGAVPALIEVVANDNRLTRSANAGRGSFSDSTGQILPVSMAAYAALMEIWGVRQADGELFGGRYSLLDPQKRAEVVGKLRAYAAKYRGVSALDRQFAVLQDDAATPAQWLDAIATLNRAPGETSNSFSIDERTGAFSYASGRGEPLRSRKEPSVSDLVERRALEVSRRALTASPENYNANNLMSTGNSLLLELSKWDLPRALPLFAPQIERIQELERAVPAGYRQSLLQTEADARLRFFRAALLAPPGQSRQSITRDYAAWLASQPFGSLDTRFYAPLWRLPDDPALAAASQALFGAPCKPFQELLLRRQTSDAMSYYRSLGYGLLETPFVSQEPFHSAVLRELDNQMPAGAVNWLGQKSKVLLVSGDSIESDVPVAPAEPRAPAGSPIRVCDVVASRIPVALPNGQRQEPLQLWWPQARRDAAIALIKKRVADKQLFSPPYPTFFDY